MKKGASTEENYPIDKILLDHLLSTQSIENDNRDSTEFGEVISKFLYEELNISQSTFVDDEDAINILEFDFHFMLKPIMMEHRTMSKYGLLEIIICTAPPPFQKVSNGYKLP